MKYIRQIVSIFTAVAALALALASSGAVAQNLAEQQVFATKMDKLLREKDFEYAQAVMLKYLEVEPDAPPVKRKLAHYYMKTTAVSVDGLIPFRYPDDSARQIVSLLDEVLAATPDDKEALSLLTYTHALQGNVELGKAALAKARLLSEKDDWLDYNAALLAIKENKLDDAAALLNPVAVEKKLPPGPDANRIYESSWYTLYKIALENPRLDPLPAVRDGLAERVLIENMPEYLLEYDQDGPPILLELSSQDTNCQPCINAMEAFYDFARNNRQQGNKYHVVYASVEPWNEISNNMDVLTSIGMRAVPAYAVVYKGEHVAGWSSSRPKVFTRMLEHQDAFLGYTSMAVKVAPRATYVLDYMLTKFNQYKDSGKAEFKAMAYAIDATDGRFWRYAHKYGYATQEEADKAALEECQAGVAERQETVECKIYAQGNEIVDSVALIRNDNREIERQKGTRRAEKYKKQREAEKQSKAKEGRLARNSGTVSTREAIARFTKIEEHYKAIALAQGESGSVSGIASKALTQRRANSEALALCNAAKEEAQLSADCQLHIIGKTEITDQTEAAIQSVTAKQQKRNAKE